MNKVKKREEAVIKTAFSEINHDKSGRDQKSNASGSSQQVFLLSVKSSSDTVLFFVHPHDYSNPAFPG